MKRSRGVRSVFAMTDIAFLLLLFFLLFSLVSRQVPEGIQVPHLKADSHDETEEQVMLFITSEGVYRDSRGPISLAEYVQRVTDAADNSPAASAGIAADRDVSYQHIEPVIAALQDAGVHSVHFLIENLEEDQ